MLVIEDCEDTGNILFEYLFPENLDRLVRERSYGWQQGKVNVAGRWFHASDYEPSEGQLQHLRRVLTDPDGTTYLPEPFLYEPGASDLKELREKLSVKSWQERIEKVEQHFRDHAHGRDPKNPKFLDPRKMIIVTDLALSDQEGNDLVAVDAIVSDEALRTRGSVPGKDRLRPKLRDCTGYQVVELFGITALEGVADYCTPVIATTFMNNPLIHQHCLLGGACAVVPKPAPAIDSSGANFDMRSGNSLKPVVQEEEARKGSDMLHVAVTHYATRLVAEVLSAVALKHALDG